MLTRAGDLVGKPIRARDGDIGHVLEMYFDDLAWMVRYIVVDTGHWLPGREVLISPIAVRAGAEISEFIPVELTREQVETSPEISTQRPISRQKEMEYFLHYGWPYYWTLPVGPSPVPPLAVPLQAQTAEEPQTPAGPPHLRSSREVKRYHIHASDGTLGHVEDFLIEQQSWAIRYLIVDTVSWWPSKHVLLSPGWVDGISWEEREVRVDLTRDQIRNAPEYDPARPVDRDFEEKLHAYYGLPKYWT